MIISLLGKSVVRPTSRIPRNIVRFAAGDAASVYEQVSRMYRNQELNQQRKRNDVLPVVNTRRKRALAVHDAGSSVASSGAPASSSKRPVFSSSKKTIKTSKFNVNYDRPVVVKELTIQHEFQLAPDAGPSISPLSHPQIQEWLNRKWAALIDTGSSAALDYQLEQRCIFVDTRALQWRADGIFHSYTMVLGAGPNASAMTDEKIHRLLREREQALLRRAYNKVDNLTEQLLLAGVFVNQKFHQYRADGIHHASDYQVYEHSDMDAPVSSLSDVEIKRWLNAHSFFAWTVKTERAIRIRAQLANEHVYFDARTRRYRKDGTKHMFARHKNAGPNASSLSEKEIHARLDQRYDAATIRDYERVEAIDKELEGTYVQ
jgi:hypothetical protein